MKKIKVDKVILYYMDRVDPDGNLYRFYVYKGMASEIEYFCTEEAGNMTIPIGLLLLLDPFFALESRLFSFLILF